MKLECSRKDLVDAIDFVVPVAAVRSPQPLFQSIRFEAAESGLHLLACDGEMWAGRTIQASVDEPGILCVQGRLLKELIASLPDGPVQLVAQPGSLEVRAGASDWRLMAFNAEDFPLIPLFSSSSEIKLTFKEICDAIDAVSYAVASENSRAILTGVLFSYDGDELTLVATDTHRLAVQKLKREGMGSNMKAVVPEKALRTLKLLPLSDGDEVAIQFDESRLMVDAGDSRIVSQLLAGAFPSWERVVPDTHTRSWTTDRHELIENLKRSLILARDSSNRVRFGVTGDNLTITARSEEKGEGKEAVALVSDNGEIEIAFNGRYVLDAVGSFRSDSVVTELTEPSRPAIFRPANEEGSSRFCVIMPMALS